VFDLKKWLMEILKCPVCKHAPLELYVFVEREEIEEGIIFCSKCRRWYPIIGGIPHLLPDELRSKSEDVKFLKRWLNEIPEKILKYGLPYNERDIR